MSKISRDEMVTIPDKGLRALVECTRALIAVSHNGECHTVRELAAHVSKASRFLFPVSTSYQYRQEDTQVNMAREAACFVQLVHTYVRPD